MLNRLLHGSSMIQYHHKLMPLTWSIFIDISILAALYSHKPFAFPVHVIGANLAGIITIVTSFASFLNGIPPVGDPMRLHKQIGTFLYMLIVTQILLGILWYIVRSSQRKSQWSLILKKMHKTVGYSIALIAKFQVLYILESSSFLFWFNLLWDTVTISLLLKAKRSKIKAESNPQLKVINTSYRQIKSIQQISFQYPNIFIYGNYVFNCDTMKNKHPAGYQVIVQSKYHCIDRYIYGMFGPENIPSIKLHSHSPKSLAMLVKPIAKIQVSEQYSNFQMQSNSVKIHSTDPICLKGGLFCVQLRLLQKQAIEYQGYSQIEQLGRYYYLTLNQQMTRLYSTVNFALSENRNFINKLNLKINNSINSLPFSQQNDNLIQGTSEHLHQQEKTIPLIIKKYNDGRFTKQLFHHQARKLTLSCSKGRGLQLTKVQQGKIIIVSGGTGLLPFCDLIDLLFKQELVKQKPQHKDYLQNKNTILKRPFLQRNTFTFIIAVNYLKEIHPIILSQLTYLAQICDRFEVYLRVKDNSDDLAKIKKVNGHFQQIIEQKIRDELVSKVLVCGPCPLNRSMKTLFQRLNFNSFLIL